MSTLSRLIQKKPKKRAVLTNKSDSITPSPQQEIIAKIREQLSAISLEVAPDNPEPTEMLSPRSQRIAEIKKNMRELDALMTNK